MSSWHIHDVPMCMGLEAGVGRALAYQSGILFIARDISSIHSFVIAQGTISDSGNILNFLSDRGLKQTNIMLNK
jgi:hypothetical protein